MRSFYSATLRRLPYNHEVSREIHKPVQTRNVLRTIIIMHRRSRSGKSKAVGVSNAEVRLFSNEPMGEHVSEDNAR